MAGSYATWLLLLEASGIPAPVREHKFLAGRGWRFDFAWPERKVAVEIEGGVWSKGRHTRGSGYINDMDKYNWATLEGWKLLRFLPDQLDKTSPILMLRDALGIDL